MRQHGELLEASDHAGDADVTVPPPDLPLDSAVDALFDGGGLSAEPGALADAPARAQNMITARSASPRAAEPSASLMAASGERDETSSSSRSRPSR